MVGRRDVCIVIGRHATTRSNTDAVDTSEIHPSYHPQHFNDASIKAPIIAKLCGIVIDQHKP